MSVVVSIDTEHQRSLSNLLPGWISP
jgi:hypothetical protein